MKLASLIVQPLLGVVFIVLGCACILTSGCETGTTGILRPVSPQVERVLTNGIATVAAVAPAAVPAPYGGLVTIACGAVLAILGAWQGLTHAKVKQLQALNNSIVPVKQL
jgi:hypothetical protein